jgi:hypothetical protein
MTVKIWLDNAIHDAERRGLAALRPLLEALARSTSGLRTADWNFDATGDADSALRRPMAAANAAVLAEPRRAEPDGR